MSTPVHAGAALLLALLCGAPGAQAADTLKGRALYAANCAICHGQAGRSVMPGAPDFDRPGPLLRADMTLLVAIRSGKNAMPAFQGRLSDRDILDVIAFMRTFH